MRRAQSWVAAAIPTRARSRATSTVCLWLLEATGMPIFMTTHTYLQRYYVELTACILRCMWLNDYTHLPATTDPTAHSNSNSNAEGRLPAVAETLVGPVI